MTPGKNHVATPSPPTFRYRMPAEWELHASTWLAWPHYHGDWPGKFEPIPWVYAEIIRHLGRHEPIDLIVNSGASEKHARKVLSKANALSKNVRFHRWPTNRVWTRDSGCTFVIATPASDLSSRAKRDRSQANDPAQSRDLVFAIKWRFNAWAKYPNYQHDEKIGSRMAKAAHAGEIRPLHGKSRVVLEGGSFEVNGRGTLLTTEECLLSKTQQRNPAMSRADYENLFSDFLGISNVIWLHSGIAGDDTHGHIDDITRFVSPGTVVTAIESDPDDPNYEPLRENIRRLRAATDQDGKPLAVIELPMPGPVVFENRRLPASYANFYIANGIVLVPVFNDPNDRVALDILAGLFPDREIVGIYSGDLIWGFGAMHCMTQQQPKT
ncbi:MAG: agmatine deiminase family protein [Terriglobales bacterium]